MGAMLVVIVVVGVGVFLHYMEDSASSMPLIMQVYQLIWKLLPIEPKMHKFTVHIPGPPGSTRGNLQKPTEWFFPNYRFMLIYMIFA